VRWDWNNSQWSYLRRTWLRKPSLLRLRRIRQSRIFRLQSKPSRFLQFSYHQNVNKHRSVLWRLLLLNYTKTRLNGDHSAFMSSWFQITYLWFSFWTWRMWHLQSRLFLQRGWNLGWNDIKRLHRWRVLSFRISVQFKMPSRKERNDGSS